MAQGNVAATCCNEKNIVLLTPKGRVAGRGSGDN